MSAFFSSDRFFGAAAAAAGGGGSAAEWSAYVTPSDCSLVTAGNLTIDTSLNAIGDALSIGITNASGGRTDTLNQAAIFSIDVASLLTDFSATADQAIFIDVQPSAIGTDFGLVFGPHLTSGANETGVCTGVTFFGGNFYGAKFVQSSFAYTGSVGTPLNSFVPITITNRGAWSGVVESSALVSGSAASAVAIAGSHNFSASTSQIVFALGTLSGTNRGEQTTTWKMRLGLAQT